MGYGSEFHLLRMMGRHRDFLSGEVAMSLGRGIQLEWFDYPRAENRESHFDAEYTALNFVRCIGLDPLIENQKYSEYWPMTGTLQSWDLVGRTNDGRIVTVEAKAHLQELKSDCKAKGKGLEIIEASLMKVRSDLGIEQSGVWTREYYQMANRVFTCWYLNKIRGIPTIHVNLYFVGDQRPDSYVCPRAIRDWKDAVSDAHEYLGLSDEQPFFRDCIKTCYVHVSGKPLCQ